MTSHINPRVTRSLSIMLACVFLWSGLVAQDRMAKAKELYAAASFEEALAALDSAPAGDGIQPLEYRILCLLALHRSDQAQLAIEALLTFRPKYRPDPSLMSPGMRTEFEETRGRIIKRRYAEAKASFDAKDYAVSQVRFDRMLDMVAGAPDDHAVAELKLLAFGFRDLAKGLAATRSPALRPTEPVAEDRQNQDSATLATAPERTVPFQGAVDGIYDASVGNVVAPVPLKPILPPLAPRDVAAVPGPGLFEVVIDEKGRVESVVVRRSISAEYDALVLKESRGWRYRPATRDGQPVKFRKVLEIYTTSLRSMRRDYRNGIRQ